MFPDAPKKLLLLLSALVIGRLIEGLLLGSFVYAVLWALLLGTLSIRALLGVRLAAKILGYLCYALGAIGIVASLPGLAPFSLALTLVSVAWCVLAIATARYMLSSAEAMAFFAGFESKSKQPEEA